MRRLIAGAGLALAVLTGAAACGSDTPGNTPTTTLPATATVDAAANTKEVCAAVEKATKESVEEFSKDVAGKITEAMGKGEGAQEAAVNLVKEWLGDWSSLIQAEADKAVDAELKSSLTTLATEISNGATKIKSFEDLDKMDSIMDSPEMTDAGEAVGKFCPGLA